MPRRSGSAAKAKSNDMVSNYISDLRKNDMNDEVYVARVIKTLGNARIEVVYSYDIKDKTDLKVGVVQAKIPGKFTGRVKKSVMVYPGTYILMSKTGVIGALAYEMIAIIDREDLTRIQEYTPIHPNILSEVTDATDLQTRTTAVQEGGFGFEGREDDDDIDIDNV